MMQTKELNDLFKDASEVSSLASTDRLMVVDDNGIPKKIAKDGLSDTISFPASAATWYRIMSGCNGGSASGGRIVVVSNPPAQESFILDWCVGRSSNYPQNTIRIINPSYGVYARDIMKKLRYCRPNTAGKCFYIDIYVEQSRVIYIAKGVSINASLMCEANPQLSTVYDSFEYDLTVPQSNSSFGGGGKSLPFNHLRNLAERRVA